MRKILSVKKLSFAVANPNNLILDRLSFDLYEGDFLVLLGHNGSGKTTLFKILSSEYSLYKGEVELEGKQISNNSDIKMLSQNPQHSTFSELTLLENCLLATQHKRSYSEIRNHLSLFSSKLVDKIDLKVSYLSGGERQVLALAMILFSPPKLLLLDEHTSALDPKISEKLMQLTADVIQKGSITTIMITHNIDFAFRYGNCLLSLSAGAIKFKAEESKKKNLSKVDLMKACFHHP